MKQRRAARAAGARRCCSRWRCRSRLAAQSAQELYQRGLVEEHANGDLKQAIALYTTGGARRATGSRVWRRGRLMRMAGAQEKLGRQADAENAYAELLRAYPEQRAEVAIAQERLTALRRRHAHERVDRPQPSLPATSCR